jgi:transposase
MAILNSNKARCGKLVELLKEYQESTASLQLPARPKELLAEIMGLAKTLSENMAPATSKNSHKGPSLDPNRENKPRSGKTGRKPGGQKGRRGVTLMPVDDPDRIVEVKVDRSRLEDDEAWKTAGVETKQVVDIKVTRVVTEYRLEILEDGDGNRIKAELPTNPEDHSQCLGAVGTVKAVAATESPTPGEAAAGTPENVGDPVERTPEGTKAIAVYGQGFKALVIYMAIFQLIPFKRLAELCANIFQIRLSVGSIHNFKKEAFERLGQFKLWAETVLGDGPFLTVDETGIRIAKKRVWIHSASNDMAVLFMPHKERGSAAMRKMGIIQRFKKFLVHDHWQAYFIFTECVHCLCNAHILRDLQKIYDNFGMRWALSMRSFLVRLNRLVETAGGRLNEFQQMKVLDAYGGLLEKASRECPMEPKPPGKKGRPKKSMARNLLERLINYRDEILRFMTDEAVPFTNNAAERDIRMAKVQQKISGCFRSWDGGEYYCLIRSYVLTCARHGMDPYDALRILFSGGLPSFMDLDGIGIVGPPAQRQISDATTLNEEESDDRQLAQAV